MFINCLAHLLHIFLVINIFAIHRFFFPLVYDHLHMPCDIAVWHSKLSSYHLTDQIAGNSHVTEEYKIMKIFKRTIDQ